MQSEWFECKVRYDKTLESGLIKKTTETYLVDALSFTEAEKRFIEEMAGSATIIKLEEIDEADVPEDIRKKAYAKDNPVYDYD